MQLLRERVKKKLGQPKECRRGLKGEGVQRSTCAEWTMRRCSQHEWGAPRRWKSLHLSRRSNAKTTVKGMPMKWIDGAAAQAAGQSSCNEWRAHQMKCTRMYRRFVEDIGFYYSNDSGWKRTQATDEYLFKPRIDTLKYASEGIKIWW